MKVSLIIVLALGATALLRKRSAAMRHWVLAAAIACAAATPALELIMPSWRIPFGTWWSASQVQVIDVPLAILQAPPDHSGTAQPPRARFVDRSMAARLFEVIWLTGVGVSLFVLLVGLGRLAWLAAHAERVTHGTWAELTREISHGFRLRRSVVLLQSDHPTLLVTWGVVRPNVLLPAGARDWPDDRIRIVLGHELAHIRRHDWSVQMIAELLKAVYWFNPLVWIACRCLRQESEHACDDVVLKLGVEGSTYATELVDLARTFTTRRRTVFSGVPAAAIARPSSLERRVRAMLNARLNHDPLTRSASIVAAIALLAVTLPIAGFGASAQTFSTVSGSVVDPLDRVIPGVTLTLSNAQSQSKYEIKSDGTGHYEFVGLPAGSYALVAEVVGFATVKREGVTLSGQPFEVNVKMQVGSIQETINVTPGRNVPRPVQAGSFRERPRGELQPDRCASSGVGGCIRQPTKIKDVKPIYPTGLPAGTGGTVALEGRIGADGFMTGLQVVTATDPSFANAAVDAVNGWEFTPTYLDGQPIDVRIKVSVTFVSQP